MATDNTITITCIYCGHTWTERVAHLEGQTATVYRSAEGQPQSHSVEYLVTCPKCHQRMVVAVQVREAPDA
ncbi:MAG: hypothetical protein GXO56_03165 [Chloroflexi bacterium]|nr:hypothetical protein [Chloroflexota bacterium]